jgi:hypothetical protein
LKKAKTARCKPGEKSVVESGENLIGGEMMQAMLKNVGSFVRSHAGTACAALLCVLTVGLGTVVASAQITVTGPVTQIGIMKFTPPGGSSSGGGWDPGASPVSGTFVVGANGHVIIGDGYGTGIFDITSSGVQTVLAPLANSSAAAIDSYGNVYVGTEYNNVLIKLPYNATTGTYTGYTTAPTAACLGGTQDTAACLYAPNLGTVAGGSGIASVVFDATGNLFFATDTNPKTNPNSVFECNVACLADTTGTKLPVLLYADTAAMGALAVDPWDNVYFTDGASGSSGKVSTLSEIPLVAGSYASSPTVLESYTNAQGYTNGISGVAVGSNGTIYFTTNADGIFAIPNSQANGPKLAGMYMVSNAGTKAVTLDTRGNVYLVPYNGTLGEDVVSMVQVGSLQVGATTIGGTATTASAMFIDSAAGCTPTLTFSATESGVATTEFATVAGSCGGGLGTGNGTFSPAVTLTGSLVSGTITFNPAKVGERVAALTVTDSTNSVSGTAKLSGVGQGIQGNLDPGATIAYGTGFTAPYAVSVDSLGDLFVADDSTGTVSEIPAGSAAGTAPTTIASGFGAAVATAFDANGNLYIADFKNNDVVEIANTSTTGGFTKGAQSTLISSSELFGGTALNKPSGLAFGPDGTLYISDLGNGRVVTYNPGSGQTGIALAGLTDPWGVAVDSSSNLYIANTGGGNVLVDEAGVVTTLTPTGVTAPWGIAVDASGSLVISDKATGNIVRVPDESGTLTVADTILIEKNPLSSLGIALDVAGNLYTTDSTGSSVYAIQRTAATVDFGTVVDGNSSSPVNVYLQNTGNETVTLGTPAITEPTNTTFDLTSTVSPKCTDGGTGASGLACEITAVFSPATGTAGTVSTTGAVNFSPSGSLTINLTGFATASALPSQNITNFAPPSPIDVGQQITLSATGGASGNPVVFTIDPASSCVSCATITGTTLTAAAAGTIIVDANQAGNTSYAAAAQVQKTIVINTVTAADVPSFLMSEVNWLPALPSSGGAFAGDNPAGTSFAVSANGQVLLGDSYGKELLLYNPTAGTLTSLSAAWANQVGGVAIDASGNLYVSGLYSPIVAKIPYVNGAYATVTDPTSGTAPAACTGSDTTECLIGALSNQSSIGGVASMAFDSHGNLFVATDDKGGNPFAIFKCTTACLNSGTPAALLLFQEPTGASPSTTGQLYIGGIAIDPWDNVFFTDSNFINQTATYGNTSTYSDLYELATSTGAGFGGATTGYAATPTLLQTYTIATPASYDNELDAVAVTATGTVYYGTQNNGIFGIPNTQTGGPDIAHQFAVSSQGAKVITLDATGNIYLISYHGSGDTLGQILVNDLTVPLAQVNGPAVTASATVVDNGFGCGTAAALTITSSNAQFVAAPGTTCSTVSSTFSNAVSASAYPATITFTSTTQGPSTATLSIVDATNGGVGTATVSGTGQETPQTINFTAPSPVTYAPGLQVTLTATGGGSGNPVVFSIDSTSTGAGTISGNTLTVTTAGNIVIDANEAGGLVGGVFYAPATQVMGTLTVNKTTQTIVFPALAPVTFTANLTVTLAATPGASSSPVVFTVDTSSTGAGAISGDTLTVTGAGNIVVDANQAADSNYLPATQVQQTLVVNKGTQTITFTPPTIPIHFIAGGITVPITVTPGVSSSPLVLTVDSSSTGAGTISGTTLTVTAPGNIVIDGNQAADNNYLVAAQAQETIAILAALPTQTISFNNPGTQVVGTPLTLVATASSGFTVGFTSSTTSVCTISGSAVTFIEAGTCTITASQPGDNATFAAAPSITQSFVVNATGTLPSFGVSFTLSSLTVAPGTVGLTTITVNSMNNFAGPVSFACSGLPSGYTCTFNPNPLTVAAGQSATTSLSVSPGSASAALHHDSRPLLPAATLAVALCFLGFKRRNRLQLLLLVVIGLFGFGMLSGCGGSSSSTTKATTSTVTVTATSGGAGAEASVTQSANFTLTVE